MQEDGIMVLASRRRSFQERPETPLPRTPGGTVLNWLLGIASAGIMGGGSYASIEYGDSLPAQIGGTVASIAIGGIVLRILGTRRGRMEIAELLENMFGNRHGD